jgi:hypothetical protein
MPAMCEITTHFRRLCFSFAAAMVAAAAMLSAQGRGAAAPADPHDLSGYWELSYDSQNVPAATLAPGITRAVLDAAAKKDVHAVRWCHIIGLPAAMGMSRPFEIVMNPKAVWIVFEVNAVNRQIALERTAHINKDEFDPTTKGDSIGRWEGDTFVVDTIGFADDRGITAIPGGGFRTSNSHLTERFRLMNSGSMLQVVSTWEDPKMFRTPHTYEFRYYKLPANYEARPALPCDAYDENRIQFVEKRIAPGQAPAAAGRPAAGR